MDERLKILLNKGRSETYVNKDASIKIDIDNISKPLPLNDIDTVVSAYDQFEKERNESTIYRFYGFVTPLISNPLYNDNIKIFKEKGEIKSTKIIGNEIFETNGWFGYYEDNSVETEERTVKVTGTYDGPVTIPVIGITIRYLAIIQLPLNTDMSSFYVGKAIEATYFDNNLGYDVTKTFKINSVETTALNTSAPYTIILHDPYKHIFGAVNNGENIDITLYETIAGAEEDGFNDNKSSLCEFAPFDPGYDRLRFLDDDDKPNYLMKITYPFNARKDIEIINGLKLTEGIPIVEKLKMHFNGRDYTGFRTPINHGLSPGDHVRIKNMLIVPIVNYPTPMGVGEVILDANGNMIGEIPNVPGYTISDTGQVAIDHVLNNNGTVYQSYYIFSGLANPGNASSDLYRVTKLGDHTNSDKGRIFVIDIDPLLAQLSVGSSTFKRVVNNQESEYYIREFSALTETYIDYDLYPAAYGTNYFLDKQTAFNFKVDVDVKDIKDNLGRPLSELFLTIIKNDEDGEPTNINTQYWVDTQDDAGISTDFWTPIKAGYDIGKPIDTSLNYNIRAVNDSDYYQTYFTNIDESDSTFIGDIVEYNPYELLERILETPYHWINTVYRENYSLFGPTIPLGNDFDDPSKPPQDKKEGYIYKPHNRIIIREYSSYIETGVEGKVINIPDYATNAYSGATVTKRWRDLLSIGYYDVAGQGVNYPFESGAHYLFLNTRFYFKRQDPACYYNLISTTLQLPPDRDLFLEIISQPTFLNYSLLNADLFITANTDDVLDLGGLSVSDEVKYGYERPVSYKCGNTLLIKHHKTLLNQSGGFYSLYKPSGVQETRWCSTKVNKWVKNRGGTNENIKDESDWYCENDDAWNEVANSTTKYYGSCEDASNDGTISNFCLEAAGMGQIILKKFKDKTGACFRYLKVDAISVEYNGEYNLGQVDTPGACISYNPIETKDIDDVC